MTLKYNKCRHEGCEKIKKFGFVNEKAVYCGTHRATGMIDVVSKRCEHLGCSCVCPVFNIAGGKGRFCFVHKTPEMVNVMHKKCEFQSCNQQPSFNYEGSKKGQYCSKHKLPNMIDVRNKRCEHAGCNINASFDLAGGKGRFCASHKSSLMEDVKRKRCEHIGCNKTNPAYNIWGLKVGRFCREHRITDMIDVIHKRCEHIGCMIISPAFDNPGGKGRFCAKHKSKDMINVQSKQCLHEGCTHQPTFDVPGGFGTYCLKHKAANMIDVKHKLCLLCPITAKNKRYLGYCFRCFVHTFPDNDIVRNYKTKERVVADNIKEYFPSKDIIIDRQIHGGCSSRRPDIFIDMGSHVVIVEIDENQHENYDSSCENRRLMELFNDAGSRPFTMIRFNPDQYNTENASVSSCWGYTSKGLCVVKKHKIQEWNTRLKVLKEHVDEAVSEAPPQKDVNVVHLFYDGWYDGEFD